MSVNRTLRAELAAIAQPHTWIGLLLGAEGELRLFEGDGNIEGGELRLYQEDEHGSKAIRRPGLARRVSKAVSFVGYAASGRRVLPLVWKQERAVRWPAADRWQTPYSWRYSFVASKPTRKRR